MNSLFFDLFVSNTNRCSRVREKSFPAGNSGRTSISSAFSRIIVSRKNALESSQVFLSLCRVAVRPAVPQKISVTSVSFDGDRAVHKECMQPSPRISPVMTANHGELRIASIGFPFLILILFSFDVSLETGAVKHRSPRTTASRCLCCWFDKLLLSVKTTPAKERGKPRMRNLPFPSQSRCTDRTGAYFEKVLQKRVERDSIE